MKWRLWSHFPLDENPDNVIYITLMKYTCKPEHIYSLNYQTKFQKHLPKAWATSKRQGQHGELWWSLRIHKESTLMNKKIPLHFHLDASNARFPSHICSYLAPLPMDLKRPNLCWNRYNYNRYKITVMATVLEHVMCVRHYPLCFWSISYWTLTLKNERCRFADENADPWKWDPYPRIYTWAQKS